MTVTKAPPKNRVPSPHVETARVPAARSGDRESVIDIPLSKLDRHPKNREIYEDDPDVLSLAESIKTHGQLEPCRVRALPNGRYQLISGERRSKALAMADIPTARCIVVTVDEQTALREVAVANAERKDLDPIERAELMVELMKPAADGGSGLTREQAGRIFGLQSESGCKNALRLLKLPETIRTLIRERKIPERLAREWIPYADCTPVMKKIIEKLRDAMKQGELDSFIADCYSDDWYIRHTVEKELRPFDLDVTHNYFYPAGKQPRLFKADAALEAKLQLVTIPAVVGQKGQDDIVEPRRYAMNVKLWDKLQEPELKRLADERAKGNTKKPSAKKAESKVLSAAELAAENKWKKVKADKQLAQFTEDWRKRLLRCAIAGHGVDITLVYLTLPWMAGWLLDGSTAREVLDAALMECRLGPAKNGNPYRRAAETVRELVRFHREHARIAGAFWRLALWPVSCLIGEGVKRHRITVPPGTLPDRLPHMEADTVDALASAVGVSAETAWRSGATEDTDERRLISVWFMKHTTEQLKGLAKELSVPVSGSTRSAIAAELLARHVPGRPLPLPKLLQDKSAKKGGAK